MVRWRGEHDGAVAIRRVWRMTEGPFESSRALLIAINDYDPAIGKLTTPEQDVREIARQLELVHGFVCRLQLDPHTGLQEIRDALIEEATLAGPDDRVVLYFAGHGIAFDADDGPVGY